MEAFIDRAFGTAGHLSKLVTGYTPRNPQISISRKVGEALEQGQHLICEAGTGTGKSLGYLVPAARWAVANKKTVIVCTHTIPLMTQIVNIELPRVAKILLMEQMQLKYQLVKGKDHYVCHHKLDALWQEKLKSNDPEAKTIRKIHSIVNREHIGDRTGMGFDIDDNLWSKISASFCPSVVKPRDCKLEDLKEKMYSSHIIVTNFAYFFNDLKIRMKTGNGSLPQYDAVIFDEAHEIEDVCCKVFEKKVDLHRFENLFENLFTRAGYLDLDHGNQLTLAQYRQTFESDLAEVYDQVGREMRDEEGNSTAFKLLDSKIEMSHVCSTLTSFIEKIKSLNMKKVSDLMDKIFEGNDDLDFISSHERDSWAYWATQKGKGDVVLHAAPLYPKVILSKHLFSAVPVILASATMSTTSKEGRTFDYFSGRMGVKEYGSIVVDSPFNYEEKTMIICPDDAPEPNSPEFTSYVPNKLKEVLMYTGGRTLVLFTSFEMMNQVARRLEIYCRERSIHLLVQFPGCDREKIIEQLKANPRTIVLGCTSFWTGVDVAGDALTTVVIVKLPYPQPDEPLTQAQMAILQKANRSSFFDFMFPKMIVKLKQGFGRLNRSMQCQGAVIILDSRIYSKRYGGRIIRNLPKCKYSRKLEAIVDILPC
ncbi:ATP-dependent DNA helicase (plasmid) [Paenibacillus sonchi]|uniref:DNA 5'-3' helicase n=1 Tax=Paenibacillus sonchi TaxID=373687 RepID=A0A974SHC8_9BACL|nr:ATP-dependent DNA helicase [Paenibacillus sonchi]QQZ64525.1 ATP-dependent DNA helicase [Paenibacillus sonchi]